MRNIEKYRIFFVFKHGNTTNIKYITCHHQSKYNSEKSQQSTISFFDPRIKKNKSYYLHYVVKVRKKYIFFGNPSE